MCDWEEFIFGCSCSYTKRKSYCHFARNDPNHQCFGVQVLKKVWEVPEICDKCSQRNNRTSSRAYQTYGQQPGEFPACCNGSDVVTDVDEEPHG
ncbi:hypothetical protein DHEL01_v201053 [Diaporthe helianthi]|uniref:Uncharacterized protein n=1 Tax=Diaporthe helianthi TaxID=158607 RepID=A0A2P5IDH3_DIAHE|nr:hypothetical protein DHEL01_v201053 [Diaporthe helianthi]